MQPTEAVDLDPVPATYNLANPADASAMQQEAAPTAADPWVHPASVQTLLLREGTYAFSVPGRRPGDGADVAPEHHPHQVQLPAMLIGPAPTARATQVELFPSPGTLDRWLAHPGDQITLRVHGSEVAVLLTSVRRKVDRPLSINVVRLDKPQPVIPGQPPLRILLHVQFLGDLFYNQGLAGPVHGGMAIEAFVVDHKDPELGNIVEYRGLTADGFETPWLSDGMLCGSRGRGVPLVGFAVRPRVLASRRRAFHYEGYFRRAGWVHADPTKGWCRSPLPDDPLEGMAVRTIDLA